MGERPVADLVVNAVNMAVKNRQPQNIHRDFLQPPAPSLCIELPVTGRI